MRPRERVGGLLGRFVLILPVNAAHAQIVLTGRSRHRAIERLVAAGEQAEINVEQMIQILNAGVSVEDLLDVIDMRLQTPREFIGYSRWVI